MPAKIKIMTEISPMELAVKRRKLSQDYNEKMKELAQIKKDKALKIISLLPENKTVSRAELIFSGTPEGQREIELTYYCKGLIELIRSLKTEVDIKNAESWGQY
jgi:hypothetical protein